MAHITFRNNPDATLTVFARILLIIAMLAIFIMLIACYMLSTGNKRIFFLVKPAWFETVPKNTTMSLYPWGQVLYM